MPKDKENKDVMYRPTIPNSDVYLCNLVLKSKVGSWNFSGKKLKLLPSNLVVVVSLLKYSFLTNLWYIN